MLMHEQAGIAPIAAMKRCGSSCSGFGRSDKKTAHVCAGGV